MKHPIPKEGAMDGMLVGFNFGIDGLFRCFWRWNGDDCSQIRLIICRWYCKILRWTCSRSNRWWYWSGSGCSCVFRWWCRMYSRFCWTLWSWCWLITCCFVCSYRWYGRNIGAYSFNYFSFNSYYCVINSIPCNNTWFIHSISSKLKHILSLTFLF